MSRALASAVLGAVLSACSANSSNVPPARHQLEGALSVVMDLGYDDCVIDTTSDEIGVRFIRIYPAQLDGGERVDTPLKVVWQQAGQVLITPSTINLAEPNPASPRQQRGSVTRNVQGDKRKVFPLMVPAMNCQVGKACTSQLSFIDAIRPDSFMRGQFSITFENGIDFANGRTVFGQFLCRVPP